MNFPYLCSLAIWCGVATLSTAGETYVFHYENVLGTSFELHIQAASEDAAHEAESVALAEIARLSDVFSTYHPQSEFSRWQASAVDWSPVSLDLLNVLTASDRWRTATGGAFHPGAELLSQLWQRAVARGEAPSNDERAAAVAALGESPWEVDVDRRIARRIGRYPLSLNAIAKGYIIDRVAARVLECSGVTGALVKIGGDLRVCGRWEQAIAIRDPQEAGDNVVPQIRVRLKDRALATSGGRFRGFDIAGRHYSHVLDPRSGATAVHVLSATVVAASAMDADALATACSVLSAVEGLALINSLNETGCLLIDAAGTQHVSRTWPALTGSETQLAFFQSESKPAPKKPVSPPWNGGFELQIDFTLNPPDSGPYRRPYVAVWVEDEAGRAVRTLVLWVQTTGPGPRWIPDLHRWYRKDFQRRQIEDLNLVATVAEPTRKSGTYKIVWDGANDRGKLVPPGKFTVFLEANRERGTYQLMRKEVAFADQPFQAKFDDNAEIKAAALEYRRRQPGPASHR